MGTLGVSPKGARLAGVAQHCAPEVGVPQVRHEHEDTRQTGVYLNVGLRVTRLARSENLVRG